MSLKIAVIGATGYTGVELLRLLQQHPQVKLCYVSSRQQAGLAVADYFPSEFHSSLKFTQPTAVELQQCDAVFFATPHGVALQQVPELVQAGVKVFDLSADYRLQDHALFQQWYGLQHTNLDVLRSAVYGLTELQRQHIVHTNVVANPGCYPTSIQLPLVPLLQQGFIEVDGIIADCKSGVSGAGRNAQIGTLFTECSESFKIYGMDGHRHAPEINQQLSIAASTSIDITFMPHLVPMSRGIEATIYAKLKAHISLVQVNELWQDCYANEPFVHALKQPQATKTVRGTNHCIFAARQLPNHRLVISSVIDNLVKGASGQAVQNMNCLFGFDETLGLEATPLWC